MKSNYQVIDLRGKVTPNAENAVLVKGISRYARQAVESNVFAHICGIAGGNLSGITGSVKQTILQEETDTPGEYVEVGRKYAIEGDGYTVSIDEDEYVSLVKFDPGTGLPDVSAEDAGKVLSVNSEGEWIAAAAPTELPSVSSVYNGQVLTVVNGSWQPALAPKLKFASDNNGDPIDFGCVIRGRTTDTTPVGVLTALTNTHTPTPSYIEIDNMSQPEQINMMLMELVEGTSNYNPLTTYSISLFWLMQRAKSEPDEQVMMSYLFPMTRTIRPDNIEYYLEIAVYAKYSALTGKFSIKFAPFICGLRISGTSTSVTIPNHKVMAYVEGY